MLVEFTPQERHHFCTIMDDILEHEQLKPNKVFRKVAKRYKNKFYGEGLVNLKVREIAELYNLASSSLGILNKIRQSETLPTEHKQDAVNYLVIVAGLVEKLKNIAINSGRLVMNVPTKLPDEK
jgi:hypothetical protein